MSAFAEMAATPAVARPLRFAKRGGTATVVAIAITLLLTAPMLFVGAGLFRTPWETLAELGSTVLLRYVGNTLILVVGVGVLSILFGTIPAWLVTTYDFPGRRLVEWVVILPLAVPPYIAAFVYAGIFDYTGPAQRFFRNFLGLSNYPRVNIMSLWGAILVMSAVLYPYVYLTVRSAFRRHTAVASQVARSLGRNGWQTMLTVALPLARPALLAGTALVAMETLGEYGAVQYYGVDTLTVGVFRTWFARGDRPAAVALSGFLMIFAVVALVAERHQRGKARYTGAAEVLRRPTPIAMRGPRRWVTLFVCLIPALIGFVVPVTQLLSWAALGGSQNQGLGSLLLTISNTLLVAGGAALLTLVMAVTLAYTVRVSQKSVADRAATLATVGYAVPGSVIALGVLIPLAAADHAVGGLLERVFGWHTGLLFSGTLLALFLALVSRYFAVGYHPIASGFTGVCGRMDEASRGLGRGPWATLIRVDLPILKRALAATLTLLFVDLLKELPLTLILRPFNFHTLATRAYQLAVDERLAAAAPYSLLIVLAGAIPVILLNAFGERQR